MDLRQAKVAELLLQHGDKLLANLGVLVEGGESMSLLSRGVSANGTDVDHTGPELDEGAPLDGDVQVGNVVENKLDKLLVRLLANVLDEAVGGERLAELEGREAVLGEAEVKQGGDGDAGGLAQLLLLLGQVGTADETDGALVAQLGQQGEHLGRGALVSSSISMGSGWSHVRGGERA